MEKKSIPFLQTTLHQTDFASRPELNQNKVTYENLLKKQSEWKDAAVQTRTNRSTYHLYFSGGDSGAGALLRGTTKGSRHTPGYGGHIPESGMKGVGLSAREPLTNIIDTYHPHMKGYTGVRRAKR